MPFAYDNKLIAIDFYSYDENFSHTLTAFFEQEELLESSSFSGEDVLTLIGTWSKVFTEKLAAFLLTQKQADAKKKLRVVIGQSEIELTGVNAKDLEVMEPHISSLIAQLREQTHDTESNKS